MNDVEELVHYCKEDDPIGALLFTGEWGSGKTHVIEHDLVDALGLDYAIVRVSLFGLNDIWHIEIQPTGILEFDYQPEHKFGRLISMTGPASLI